MENWRPVLNCDLCGETIIKFGNANAYYSWSDEDEKEYHSVVPIYAHSDCYNRLDESGLPPWIGVVESMTITDYVRMLWEKHPLSTSFLHAGNMVSSPDTDLPKN